MSRNILIICSTNSDYMPYLKNYTKILDDYRIEYDLLVWDRMKLEEKDAVFIYNDRKNSVRRNFLDYYKFYCYIKSVLAGNSFDKIIIFGLQTMFFCQWLLCRNYSQKFILDIRDYHLLAKGINFSNVIKNAKYIVISSLGYKEFLPSSIEYEYIVNHNTTIDFADIENSSDVEFNSRYITYMGSLRDIEINKKLIESLGNSAYQAYYAGESDYTQLLKDFVSNGKYNVKFTGRYKKSEEKNIYDQTLLVNVLRYADCLNNKLALPNRLYNAPLYMKPLLAYEGTYLAELIRKYNLGLVIHDFNNIDSSINKYIDSFDQMVYQNGRKSFLNKVINENLTFKQKLIDFAKS